jgi:thymidylate synthase
MKPYLKLLEDIMLNGHSHPDRTGTGRRSIFGADIRFDMREGFPIVTTRKIPYQQAFKEMLWFISGKTDISILKEQGVNIWNKWTPTDTDIDYVIDNVPFNTELSEEKLLEGKNSMREYFNNFKNEIGPMYGYVWRHAPVSESTLKEIRPHTPFKNIASDKLSHYKKIYDDTDPKDQGGKDIPFEIYAEIVNSSTVDQLQDLIINLKNDPHSARHIVTAWLPVSIFNHIFLKKLNHYHSLHNQLYRV